MDRFWRFCSGFFSHLISLPLPLPAPVCREVSRILWKKVELTVFTLPLAFSFDAVSFIKRLGVFYSPFFWTIFRQVNDLTCQRDVLPAPPPPCPYHGQLDCARLKDLEIFLRFLLLFFARVVLSFLSRVDFVPDARPPAGREPLSSIRPPQFFFHPWASPQ